MPLYPPQDKPCAAGEDIFRLHRAVLLGQHRTGETQADAEVVLPGVFAPVKPLKKPGQLLRVEARPIILHRDLCENGCLPCRYLHP